MDRLDAAILRELLRGRELLWGGGDPRLGGSDLAERVGVDRTTVWARLKNWREAGFLVRQEVVPNPALFGAGIAGGDIRVTDPRQKQAVLDRLQLVEGVLSGMDHVGPYVILLYAMDNEAALQRCRRLVGQLPQVEEASVCIPFHSPTTQLEPTATDWRILRALRRLPEVPFKEVADEAGVSARTLTRRYQDLLDANAIWTFPLFDFTKYEDAIFVRYVVELDDQGQVAPFVNACRRDTPEAVWVDAARPKLDGMEALPGFADVYCHVNAATEVETVAWQLADHAGVVDVETFYPKRWFVVASWFDERIAKHTGASR